MSVRLAGFTLLLLSAAVLSACVRNAGHRLSYTPVSTTASTNSVVRVPAAPLRRPTPSPSTASDAAPRTEPLVAPARAADGPVSSSHYDKPGFKTYMRDGRLWVFKDGSKGLDEFHAHGEPGKNVTLIGEGPNGMTLKGSERDDLISYRAAHRYAKRGFAVFEENGRLWVLREGSEGLQQFLSSGEPARSVTLVGDGPDGKTLRSSDMETAKAFLGR